MIKYLFNVGATPLTFMNLFKLFLFLSSASACIIPLIPLTSRSLLSQRNRAISQSRINGFLRRSRFDSVPDKKFNGLIKSGALDSNDQSILKSQLSEINMNLNDQNRQMIPRETNMFNYESLLEIGDINSILKAYKSHLINFDYIPKNKNFYLIFLDTPEGNEIIQMYFKHRTFEKMRQMGTLTYEEIYKAAVLRSNYFVANIVIKHLVAEVEYKAYTDYLSDSKWMFSKEMLRGSPFGIFEMFPSWNVFLKTINELSEDDKQKIMFFINLSLYSSIIPKN